MWIFFLSLSHPLPRWFNHNTRNNRVFFLLTNNNDDDDDDVLYVIIIIIFIPWINTYTENNHWRKKRFFRVRKTDTQNKLLNIEQTSISVYVRVYVCIRISFIPDDLHIVVPSSWSSTTSIQHCRSSSYMIVIVLFFFLSIYLSLIFSSMSFLSWRVLFFRPTNQPTKQKTNQSNHQNISHEGRVEVG